MEALREEIETFKQIEEDKAISKELVLTQLETTIEEWVTMIITEFESRLNNKIYTLTKDTDLTRLVWMSYCGDNDNYSDITAEVRVDTFEDFFKLEEDVIEQIRSRIEKRLRDTFNLQAVRVFGFFLQKSITIDFKLI